MKKVNHKELGNMIRHFRKEAGLTQSELAKRIGITTSTISRYEKGSIDDVKIPVIESIAHALSINPNTLLDTTQENEFCKRLNYIMEKRGLRQIDDLALCKPFCDEKNIKMGRNTISQYVSGKVVPNQKSLIILSKALKVSASWLYGISETENNDKDVAKLSICQELIEQLSDQDFEMWIEMGKVLLKK